MQDTLENHQLTISIGGILIFNLRFDDNINLLAGSESEVQVLTDSSETIASSYSNKSREEQDTHRI